MVSLAPAAWAAIVKFTALVPSLRRMTAFVVQPAGAVLACASAHRGGGFAGCPACDWPDVSKRAREKYTERTARTCPRLPARWKTVHLRPGLRTLQVNVSRRSHTIFPHFTRVSVGPSTSISEYAKSLFSVCASRESFVPC